MTDDELGTERDAGVAERVATDEPSLAVTLENRLMSHGIYVTTASWTGEADQPVDDGAGLNLKYEIVSNATTVTSDEVGAVVRSLLTISDEREWTPGRLEVTSLTTDGAIRGRWRVEREWFERLGTELSQVEFSRRVLTTIENNRRDRDS